MTTEEPCIQYSQAGKQEIQENRNGNHPQETASYKLNGWYGLKYKPRIESVSFVTSVAEMDRKPVSMGRIRMSKTCMK
jgi:hypothetical protein